MSNDLPATKADLRDLKQFILEREIVSLRWVIGIQITYFFGTLAMIWLTCSLR